MSQKPNILWICSDQQRSDTLGCYGNPYVHTPHIDALAAGGVRLSRAYVQSPVCAPSRASFLSGRYPRTCGVRQNGQNIPGDECLVPRLFADDGYACGLSGKLHISVCHPTVSTEVERRIDDGYDFFAWSHHPEKSGRGHAHVNAYTQWLLSQGLDYDTPSLPECKYVQQGLPAAYSQTTWCFGEAIRFIDEQPEGRPWFFSLNCFDPHHPFDPPAAYLDRYRPILDDIPLPDYVPGELDGKPLFQRKDHIGKSNMAGAYPYADMTDRDRRFITAAYWAMIDQIDDQVGRIVAHLKAIGQYENTLIIYTSDHGESLGDHGIYLKGPYLYESNVHVPFIIHWAGHTLQGVTRDALVEMIDIAPTLCKAAGIDRPVAFQGRSFLPLVTDAQVPDAFRHSVYTEFYNANINHREPQAFLTMVFDGRWKLVKVHAPENAPILPEGELYDLQNDPGEHINLYDDPACLAEQARMLALMCDRMAQTVDPLPIRYAAW